MLLDHSMSCITITSCSIYNSYYDNQELIETEEEKIGAVRGTALKGHTDLREIVGLENGKRLLLDLTAVVT